MKNNSYKPLEIENFILYLQSKTSQSTSTKCFMERKTGMLVIPDPRYEKDPKHG